MSSVRRWVLTYTELEAALHACLFQFQLERFVLPNGLNPVQLSSNVCQKERLQTLLHWGNAHTVSL